MLIGITSTIPSEIVYAAGHTPCDLNNIFINDSNPQHYIEKAERSGFPVTGCAWIKGIYGVLGERPDITKIIVVSGGDCSNSIALGEVLKHDGHCIIPFSYPPTAETAAVESSLNLLATEFMVTPEAIRPSKQKLDLIRCRLQELDRLTWQEHRISGQENLEFLVSASDFRGAPEGFLETLETFLETARQRPAKPPEIRLGLVGVPPILSDLFPTLESLGAEVLFNEVPRQFAMPWAKSCSLAEQYSHYTYPYQFSRRVNDIETAIQQRHLDGIIHYTQSFCFRQIEDIILKREIDLPVLTLEADRPTTVDGRTLTRLETFIEMLRWKKSSK